MSMVINSITAKRKPYTGTWLTSEPKPTNKLSGSTDCNIIAMRLRVSDQFYMNFVAKYY